MHSPSSQHFTAQGFPGKEVAQCVGWMDSAHANWQALLLLSSLAIKKQSLFKGVALRLQGNLPLVRHVHHVACFIYKEAATNLHRRAVVYGPLIMKLKTTRPSVTEVQRLERPAVIRDVPGLSPRNTMFLNFLLRNEIANVRDLNFSHFLSS